MQVMILKVLFVLVSTVYCYGDLSIRDRRYGEMPELFHLDNFDQCMLLESEALYCTVTFQLKPLYEDNERFVWNIIQNFSSDPRNYRHDELRHGVCLPTTCPNSTQQLKELSVRDTLEACYNQKYNHLGLKGNITKIKCLTAEDEYGIDVYDILFAVFLMFYTMFIVFASMYEGLARYQKRDVYERVTGSTGGRIIAAFSLPKNWARLRRTNENPDSRKLRSIQGMRFYNMICVILCHTLLIDFAGPIANPQYIENLTKKPLNMFVANGNYAVQTYFLISAWLLSFQFFQMFEGRKSISSKYLFVAIINRYIRLTPTLAVMVAFQSSWLVHLGKGPNWDMAVGQEYRNCRQNGWTNLLYLNNYINKDDMCLHQTWYIASDTQLYIASLILLMIMWKKQRHIKVILGTVIATGLLVQGGIAYVKNYDIVIHQYPEALYDLQGLRHPAWHDLYSSGYSNIVGYTIGLTFGYIFYKYRNKALVINKIHVVLWWILTFGLCDFIILIASVMYEPDFKSTPLGSAVYWALGKNLFALGIAIGIFGFSQKIGWFSRWFCEWSPINVLGRLTYSTYIVHPTLIRLRAGYLRAPLFVNDYTLLMTTIGDITLSYLFGTLLCLMFEMPISALQKLMIPQVNNRRLKESTENSLKTLEDTCDETEKENNGV